MRKFRSRLRRTLKQIFILGLLLAGVATQLTSQLPPHIYPWLWVVLFVGIFAWLFSKWQSGSKKFINANGYVFLTRENETEHRHIAKTLIRRRLARNEVVHHINGKKTDNRVWNLCLMDREKHEHFHAWLRWKREKTGRYPSLREQKRILVSEYRGTLLETVVPSRGTGS